VITVTVDLPDKEAREDTAVVFASTTFDIQSYPGARSMTMYLPDEFAFVVDDIHLDAADARSLAAALLAAADASEAQG